MARRHKGERVLGPYVYRRRGKQCWRVLLVGSTGARQADYFETEREADGFARAARQRISDEERLGVVLGGYEQYLRIKGNVPKSVLDTTGRLRLFFGDLDTPICKVTPGLLEKRYQHRRKHLAVASHQGELAEVKTFLRWCVLKKRLFPPSFLDHLAELQGVGKRAKGKPQLTVDESRLFVASALVIGGEKAAAALCALILALRAREILERRGRDLDDDGRLLWVWAGKTASARRRVNVPEPLRSLLLQLKDEHDPDAYLFKGNCGGHRGKTWLRKTVRGVCEKAGVPYVCPHGLRGTHATLAETAGASPETVAASLGHSDTKITAQHYTQPGARAGAAQDRTLRVIEGGQDPVTRNNGNQEIVVPVEKRGREVAP